MQQALKATDFESRAISPLLEMGAYEALWLRKGASFKSIAEIFRENLGAVPSDFVSEAEALDCARRVMDALHSDGVKDFGVRVHGAGEYPDKLRDARHPIELLYYRGWWDLVDTPCIAVVGTRSPSKDGIAPELQRISGWRGISNGRHAGGAPPRTNPQAWRRPGRIVGGN